MSNRPKIQRVRTVIIIRDTPGEKQPIEVDISFEPSLKKVNALGMTSPAVNAGIKVAKLFRSHWEKIIAFTPPTEEGDKQLAEEQSTILGPSGRPASDDLRII